MVHHERLSHELVTEKEYAVGVCMEREAKRRRRYRASKEIYSKALEGKAPTVPGIGQPYELPLNPEITINTAKYTPEECARKILETLLRFYL